MGAGDATLELPAADIDPAPENSPLPAAAADTAAVAPQFGGGGPLHAALITPADGLEPAAATVGDDEDPPQNDNTSGTAMQLDRAQSGWFETRGSANTDVLAHDVVPAELLAPYEPLAAAAESQLAETPEPVSVAELPPPATAGGDRPAGSLRPPADDYRHQQESQSTPVPEQLATDAGASDGRTQLVAEEVPHDITRDENGAEQVQPEQVQPSSTLFSLLRYFMLSLGCA